VNGATLALDLGTNTGFAILRADGRIESGTARFAPKENEGPGVRFVRFRRWLAEVKESHPDVSRIVYERVVFGGGAPGKGHQTYAAQVYGGFLAIVQMFGEQHSIAYDEFGVSTIKKQFAGHGKAAKVDVIQQCKAMGFSPGSDNEADAIALLHVATGNAPLLTMSGATPKGTRKPKAQPEVAAGLPPF
jgi:hypothetical protein